ncbi:MAG: terpene cyclase/mutase family protein [Planctomycetota bacterium]
MSARYDVRTPRARVPKEQSYSDRSAESLAAPVGHAIRRTRQWLLGQQDDDGSWCAELEGDTILESETILMLAFLGREDTPLARRAAAYLVGKQLPEGGWAKFPGGRLDISGSVKAYFALKLTGHNPASEFMERARRAIRAHGGAESVNSFTRFYLALLGQISYEHCPAVPPEMVLLPKWFPVNLSAMSAWSRTIVVPLSIVAALEPVRPIEPPRGIHELFLREPEHWPPLRCSGLPGGIGWLSWDHFFRGINRLLKFGQRKGLMFWRKRAIEAAKNWMLARFRESDGLGAIFPPIVFSTVALKALGYADDSPEVVECLKQLERLAIHDPSDGTTRLQPCFSPVWDTGLVMRALAVAGVPADDPAIVRAADWLRSRQAMVPGDWAETVDAAPGGWYFEYANEFYPDVDDTAMSLMALQTLFRDERNISPLPMREGQEVRAWDSHSPSSQPSSGGRGGTDLHALAQPLIAIPAGGRSVELKDSVAAVERGMRWMLAMQNRDGGWGAFDRDNDRHFLCYVPFADHNAMIDPSTADLCGRVLEALGKLGRRVGNPHVDRAVEFVRRNQEADGSWFGRWGVNYIYGTWQALTGLIEVGVPRDDLAVVAGGKWLLAHQQGNGGWGESPNSYERPELRGQGQTTASQTAWAVLGLIAAGMAEHPAVLRGVRYLAQTQNHDGTWDESQFTGTGFPCVFYLRYHYYPIYFPLMALAQWANHVPS